MKNIVSLQLQVRVLLPCTDYLILLSVIDELLTYINVRSYHWILLTIEVDAGRVEIKDSLMRDESNYAFIKDALQR